MTESLIAAGIMLALAGTLASWVSHSWHTMLRNGITDMLDRHPPATRSRRISGGGALTAGILLVVLGLLGADAWTGAPVVIAAAVLVVVSGRGAAGSRAK